MKIKTRPHALQNSSRFQHRKENENPSTLLQRHRVYHFISQYPWQLEHTSTILRICSLSGSFQNSQVILSPFVLQSEKESHVSKKTFKKAPLVWRLDPLLIAKFQVLLSCPLLDLLDAGPLLLLPPHAAARHTLSLHAHTTSKLLDAPLKLAYGSAASRVLLDAAGLHVDQPTFLLSSSVLHSVRVQQLDVKASSKLAGRAKCGLLYQFKAVLLHLSKMNVLDFLLEAPHLGRGFFVHTRCCHSCWTSLLLKAVARAPLFQQLSSFSFYTTLLYEAREVLAGLMLPWAVVKLDVSSPFSRDPSPCALP
ncbi:hypothetical protein LR48_Vigan02g105500 [Vigna angularis]|uniref:Uncharacterized protein n=1 Tax=Phaseolus angularis TaxID=3914 RepID=A0A0L9TWI0_PHAAN|nr:hypothetical protein LR48_Vigan02g105500 [Vigna angularis]